MELKNQQEVSTGLKIFWFLQKDSGFMNCLLYHYALHIYVYFINYLQHTHLLHITTYTYQIVHVNKMLKLIVYKMLFFGH